MGCSPACQIFERFITALEWIGKRHMPEEVIIHIRDHLLSRHKHRSCVNFTKTFVWKSVPILGYLCLQGKQWDPQQL